MQDTSTNPKSERGFQIKNLSLEDKNKLVGAFVWLVQEDKKQNPENYQPRNEEYD